MKKILLLAAGTFLLSPLPAGARPLEDQVQFGKDIVVEAHGDNADLVCFYCSIRVHGGLKGDAVTIGGGIEIDGTVDGDAVAAGGGIRLAPNSKVTGEAFSVGGPLERGAQASVAGDTEAAAWVYIPGQRQLFLPAFSIYLGVMLVLAGLVAQILRVHRVEVMAAAIRQHPALTLLAGCVAFAVAVLFLTLSNYLGKVQPVLATLVLLVLMLAAVVGSSGVSFWLGGKIPRLKSLLAATLAGALVITLLQAVPIAGAFVFCVFFVLALGCAILSGFGNAPRWLVERLAGRRPLARRAPLESGQAPPPSSS